MMFNKKIMGFTVVIACILSACVSPSASSSLDFLEGKTNGASKAEIIKDLTRSSKNPGVFDSYHVEAFPLTDSYYQALVEDVAEKEGLSSVQANERVERLKEQNKNRTCFSVGLYSRDTIDATNLKYWGTTVIQNGKAISVQFQHPEQFGYSNTKRHFYTQTINNTIYLNSYDDTLYFNADELCTSEGVKVDFTKPFDLVLQPRFERNLRPLTLQWLEPKKGIENRDQLRSAKKRDSF